MGHRATILPFVLVSAIIYSAMSKIAPSPAEFFPEIQGNLTKITWAHAVNSVNELEKALHSGNVMMIEADVSMGKLENHPDLPDIPIMAHPPKTVSDLSLVEFLHRTIHIKKCGIKLDFKSIIAFNHSKEILKKFHDDMTIPIVINADIIPGPVNASTTPVNAQEFLKGAAETIPESILSLGWTTRYGAAESITKGSYTNTQLHEMVMAIYDNHVKQSVTFAVRAGLISHQLKAMQTLLVNAIENNSTLTIWSSPHDFVDADSLSSLIKTIGENKIYIDVPDELKKRLNL